MLKDSIIYHVLNAGGALNTAQALEHTLEHFQAIVQSSDDAIISKTDASGINAGLVGELASALCVMPNTFIV